MVTDITEAMVQKQPFVEVQDELYKYLFWTKTMPKWTSPGWSYKSIDEEINKFKTSGNFLEFQQYPDEIARQMTIIEQRHSWSIETREFLKKGWTTDDIPTPKLDQYIAYTNRVRNIATLYLIIFYR